MSSFGATLARSRSRWIEHHFSGLAFRFNATLRGDSRLVVPLSRQSSRISKFADLYAAIADEIFVILEKDVPFFRQAEILDFRVFAAGDQGVRRGGVGDGLRVFYVLCTNRIPTLSLESEERPE